MGIDTEAEPSAQELAALIAQLREETVAALFVENITSPALVEQISEETGLEIDGVSQTAHPALPYESIADLQVETLNVCSVRAIDIDSRCWERRLSFVVSQLVFRLLSR